MGLSQALAPQREVEGEDEDQELVGSQGQAGPGGAAAAHRRAINWHQMWG